MPDLLGIGLPTLAAPGCRGPSLRMAGANFTARRAGAYVGWGWGFVFWARCGRWLGGLGGERLGMTVGGAGRMACLAFSSVLLIWRTQHTPAVRGPDCCLLVPASDAFHLRRVVWLRHPVHGADALAPNFVALAISPSRLWPLACFELLSPSLPSS